MKKTLLRIVLFLVPFLLFSCSRKPDITIDQMLFDMNGKTMKYTSTFANIAENWKFNNSNTFRIDKANPKYLGNEAEIIATVYNENIFIPPNQMYGLLRYNIQGYGDIKLKYIWANNEWKLIKIESISFTDKGPWTK